MVGPGALGEELGHAQAPRVAVARYIEPGDDAAAATAGSTPRARSRSSRPLRRSLSTALSSWSCSGCSTTSSTWLRSSSSGTMRSGRSATPGNAVAPCRLTRSDRWARRASPSRNGGVALGGVVAVGAAVLVRPADPFGPFVGDPMVADVRKPAATPLVEAGRRMLFTPEVESEAGLGVLVSVEGAVPLGATSSAAAGSSTSRRRRGR